IGRITCMSTLDAAFRRPAAVPPRLAVPQLRSRVDPGRKEPATAISTLKEKQNQHHDSDEPRDCTQKQQIVLPREALETAAKVRRLF
ncbi:MAG TPA: hypothetical protein VGW38_20110, partial [Chloroflexota bacterium]|nr:hypothetical protein [Chloroflexota bacterium]